MIDYDAPHMTTVFLLREYHWMAMWKGRLAPACLNSKGAAQAWIDVCNSKGKYHS